MLLRSTSSESTACAGLAGVVSCLWTQMRRLASSSRAKSVKVPPISTPIRQVMLVPAFGLLRREARNLALEVIRQTEHEVLAQLELLDGDEFVWFVGLVYVAGTADGARDAAAHRDDARLGAEGDLTVLVLVRELLGKTYHFGIRRRVERGERRGFLEREAAIRVHLVH